MVGLAIICQVPNTDYYPEPFENPDPAYMYVLDVLETSADDVPGVVWEDPVSAGRPVAGAIATAMLNGGNSKDDIGMTCISWYLGDILIVE